jgi:hypothetical protein
MRRSFGTLSVVVVCLLSAFGAVGVRAVTASPESHATTIEPAAVVTSTIAVMSPSAVRSPAPLRAGIIVAAAGAVLAALLLFAIRRRPRVAERPPARLPVRRRGPPLLSRVLAPAP